MELTLIVGLLLALVTTIFSFIGFKDRFLLEKYKFVVGKVRFNKDYYRIATAAFFHKNWWQLLVNVLHLVLFSQYLLPVTGLGQFLLLYAVGACAGNLLALLVYKNKAYYTSLGATGGVAAIVFATVFLIPGLKMSFWGLLPALPGGVFAAVYLLLSFGVRRSAGVGYEAQLSGALIALIVTISLYPNLLTVNYISVLAIALPALLLLLFLYYKPEMLVPGNQKRKLETVYNTSFEDRINANKNAQQKDLDFLLEKIHTKGIDSLSKDERNQLEELSNKLK